jgi:hypothetical protein
MNDLDVLRTHGPAPTRLTADVLERARTTLREEMDPHSDASVPAVNGVSPRRSTRRRVFALGLLAASVAGVAVLTPPLLGTSGSGAIALAPVSPLTFPVTPARVPRGLGEPVFDRDIGFTMAQYRGTGANRISILVPESPDYWDIPADARHLDIHGQDARMFTGPDSAVVVTWTEPNGEVVGVSGRGHYADPNQVEAFAESITDRAQPVDLVLTVAPEGWTPSAYKEDRIVRFSGADGESLTVAILDRMSQGLTGYGAADVTAIEVSGQAGLLGRTGDGWILEGRTADGTPFSLQAPASFTKEQVVAVANGVRHRS